MKLVKYIFTIPFSPKKNWKEAIKLIDNSSNIKEDVLLLFLITSLIPILFSMFFNMHWYDIESSIKQILITYIEVVFKFVFIYFGISIFGSVLKVNKIPSYKLMSMLMLTFAFVNLGQFLISQYFYTDQMFELDLYYLPWYYFALKMLVNLMGAIVLVIGFLECSETSFKSHEFKNNYGNVILFFIAINGINYAYNFVYSNFIYGLFYSYMY